MPGTGAAAGCTSADALLAGAVVCAGVGYAEGGRLSRTLGGPQVIAWALVLSLPFATALTGARLLRARDAVARRDVAGVGGPRLPRPVLVCSSDSSSGIAASPLGGVARIGQLQLLQPFLSVLAAGVLVGETINLRTLAFAVAVALIVAVGTPRGGPAHRGALNRRRRRRQRSQWPRWKP